MKLHNYDFMEIRRFSNAVYIYFLHTLWQYGRIWTQFVFKVWTVIQDKLVMIQ